MSSKVVIIGGGLAGISAAVAALAQGRQPLLLERTAGLGGRARSLFARDVDSMIDNGQHVLAASYHETRRLLRRLGQENAIHFQQPLSIHFRFNQRRNFPFRAWRLPAPLHFLLPLLFGAPLSRSDRRYLFRWGRRFRQTVPEQLKPLTVRQWLDEAGQSPLLEQLLWEPLTLATLNTPLRQASAFLLYQVLQKAFLSSAATSGLGLATRLLGEIFARPAEQFIRQQGGEVRTFCTAKHLLREGNRVSAVMTQKGERIEAAETISALPPNALARLLADSGLSGIIPTDITGFRYSPIITVNLWCRRAIPGDFPAGLVDSPLQWIFELPHPAQKPGLYGYTFVISAAEHLVTMDAQTLLDLCDRECRHFFARGLRDHFQPVHYKIVKEKQATFLQTPQSLTLRPPPRTSLANFTLAGDWFDTGVPATIESAVLSGRMAVEALGDAPAPPDT